MMDVIGKAVLDDAFVGFWECNIPADTAYLSTAFKAMFGYADNELANLPATWRDLIFPEDLNSVTDAYNEHVKSHGVIPWQNQVRYRHKNGSAVWVNSTGRVTKWDEKGQPVIITGCNIDITAQKTAEQRLTKAESLLDLTNQVARVGCWEYDVVNNKLWWSKVIRQIYEVPDDYMPEPDLGTDKSFIKDEDSRQLAIAAMQQTINTGQSFDLILKVVTAQGREIWTRNTGQGEFINGVCVRIYGTFQDIDSWKRTKEELEISETQFRSAFDNATIGVALLSPQGIWIKVNRALCNMLGYTSHEFMTKTFQEITHPDDLERDLNMVEKILADEISNYQMEKRYIHKNGKIIWGLLSVSLVRDNLGEPLHFVSQIENITERRKAEKKLKESEAKYRKIFENVQDVFYQTDYDGILTEISPSIENYSGYKRRDVIGTHVENFYYYPEDRKQLIELLKTHGKISDFQVRIRTVGTEEPVYTSINAHVIIDKKTGLISGFEGSMRDITQRKKAEDALKERDALLTKLSEQIPGAIYQFQYFPDGHSSVPFSSNGVFDLFGVTPEEIKTDAKPIFERIHGDDFPAFYKSILTSYKTLNKWEQEARVSIPGKDVKWVRGISRPEKQPDGSVIWHGYITDITEKKLKEQELQNTFELVTEQNNRLINFAYIISHNLRTHSGNFEVLVNLIFEAETRAEEIELLQHLQKVSMQLSETIVHLNDVVSIQTRISDQRSKINLYGYIEKTINILKVSSSHRQVTINNLVDVELEIEYNPAYIESILFNFLSNAIKYGNLDGETIVTFSCYIEDKRWVLEISDNGLGIDLEKNGDKLFGMYKTFHANSDAKGIGLFITKNQVEAMGGKIEVVSEVNKGTTFKVYLT